MKKVYLIHRWDWGPNDDWRPWLKNELEKIGFSVFSPQMPDPNVPVIGKWVKHIEGMVENLDEETYLIGHSIGCQTILRYLQSVDVPVGGAVFVSGWFNLYNLEDEETKEIAKPWIETPINLEKIKRVLPKSTLIISNNDPYDCLEENIKKFTELGSKIKILDGAGHITEEDGFSELPEALEAILEISK
ncbi:MAG: alpha/beta hydrolase [Minisyncoccia bacterium]